MAIELTAGSVVTAQGSLDMYVFHRKSASHSEEPLHIAVKDPKSGIKEPGGVVEIIPSGHPRTRKNWTKRRLASEDKGYLKFLVKRTSGRAFGGSMGAFYIAPRSTAPVMQISIEVPTDASSPLSKLYITGRFDLLTLEEIQSLGLGSTANGSTEEHMFDPDMLADIMVVEQLEQAIAPKLKTKIKTTTTGNKRTGVVRVRRTRRISSV